MRQTFLLRVAAIVATAFVAGAMLFIAGCRMPVPTETLRDQGDRMFERDEYEQAAAKYEAIIERYPGDWRAQYRLGLTRLRLGNAAAARRALEVAHTARPGDERVADALAEAMYAQGEYTELFAFLRQRAQSAQTPEAYLRLAEYARALDDPDSARAAIETAIVLDGAQSVEPYLVAAAFHEELGDLDEALRRLRQALSVDPTDERVRARIRALGEVPGPSIALPPGR